MTTIITTTITTIITVIIIVIRRAMTVQKHEQHFSFKYY